MRHGIVGDVHEPFAHPLYRAFCEDTFEAWGVDRVWFVGDIVDLHAVSFHKPDPNGMSAGDEGSLARAAVAEWVRAFPRAGVAIGNHDERHYRRARAEGIPDMFLRTFREVWGTPNWRWAFSHDVDGVRLQHGTNTSGKDAAINQAVNRRQSVIQGHTHCWAGVKHHASDRDRIFGMNVGCGIDIDSYAMAYGKDFAIRPVLGCGLLIDGVPFFEPMPCGVGETYHKSRARRRKAA